MRGNIGFLLIFFFFFYSICRVLPWMGIGSNIPVDAELYDGSFRVISNYKLLLFQAEKGVKGIKKEGRQREKMGQS